MTTRAFEIVALKHKGLLVHELSQIPELKDKTLAKARQIARLYGLLHDSGHPAFSHAAESLVPSGKHEAVSIHVIQEVLGTLIDETFFEGAVALLVRLMEKSPELVFLRQFVAGEVDMDRTDYLLRDSLHCGVEYGKFDFRRLLEALTVFQNTDTGRLELAIERGGEHAFESLVLARYQMHTQVYYHKIRRIYDHYLNKYLKLRFPKGYADFHDVLKYDDFKFLVDIASDANAGNERSEIAKKISERKHHRVVFQSGDGADVFDLKRARRVHETLKKKFPDIDFFLDNAEGSIHKLSVPGDNEESKVEDFFILEKGGGTKLLTADSAILKKIPKTFRVVRIFADAAPETINEVRAKANEQ